ncbi:hypothetical protein [Armatimonas sp.]|uniref:hypothetical protein n=1 Tax=Armatimonas sp. TaxID=1872638 RepID=UPI00374DF9C2
MNFTLPEVRRDRDRHLARFFRDICYLDSCEGCHAHNAWFARQLGVVESTVKRLLAVLVQNGLIEIEYAHGRRVAIRPLAPLADVLQAGWVALCEAVLDRQKFPALLRRMAASVLNRLGLRRGPNLAKLGVSPTQNCAPPAPGNAPLLSALRVSQESQQTEQSATLADPAAVTLLRENGLPEPDAVSIAVEVTKNAWPLERVKQALRAARARGESLRNLGGFVRAALRGGWLPPASPANHPSDLGERPQRVVKALRPIPPDWLPGVDYEVARSFCNEAARLIRLEGTERPSDTEIRDRARLLWQREHPQAVSLWQVTPR